MSKINTAFIVFTKPWKLPLAELGQFVKTLGFDGVELPIRPGYQVEPENIGRDLPRAVKLLAEFGLKIGSVAGPTDEKTIAACAEAQIRLIRVGADIPVGKNYLSAIADHQRAWEALIPLLDKYQVSLGLQNHVDRFPANAAQLRQAVAPFDPRRVGIIWDAAHNALQGEDVDIALDQVWSHLRLVNLKNSYWKRVSGPEAPVAKWEHYWTTGRQGLANWSWVAQELKKRGYAGDICLTAEYTDTAAVDRLIAEDIQYAKSLFA